MGHEETKVSKSSSGRIVLMFLLKKRQMEAEKPLKTATEGGIRPRPPSLKGREAWSH